MKHKIAYILLMMAGVVTACSENKEEPTTPTPTPTPVVEPVVEEQVPIGFNAFADMPATTRDGDTPETVYGISGRGTNEDPYTFNKDITSTLNAATGDTKGFGVFAIYTGDSTYRSNPPSTAKRQIVMKNQQVTTSDNGATWTYSPLRFWPGNTDNISFFAYAPYLADNDTALSIPAVSTATNDGGYTYFELDNNNKLKAPTIAWDHTLQRDLVYGVANANVTDVNGDPIKYAGDDYTDMRRPSDGTLHWKLKHALARAKFTVINYLQYGEQLKAESISLFNSQNLYSYEPDDPDDPNEMFLDETDNESQIPYQGEYITISGEDNNYLHRFMALERRLIITDVSFKKLNRSGNLALMNEVANNDPVWDIKSTYTGTNGEVYHLAPLNPLIGENFNSYAAAFDKLVKNDTVSLNVAFKEKNNSDNHPEVDSSKDHYVLLLPQKYNPSEPIEVTVTYKICTYARLGHNFTWDAENHRPVHVVGDTGYFKEYYLEDDTETSITGALRFDIEPNKTFNILITLGKLMNVSYELTDWDDNHTIVIPPFE